MRLVSVVGARPQFIKAAAIERGVQRNNAAGRDHLQHLLVHTGQHYDPAMSQVFFDEFGIPDPVVDLGVGSGTHGAQTGRMLILIEQALKELSPDLVLAYGDTNSTL